MEAHSGSHQVVAEFLRQMGIDQYQWDGVPLTLFFESLGTLHLELTDRGLVLALFRIIQEYEVTEKAAKALRSVHLDQQLPLAIHAGMNGDDQLAFIVTMPERQVTIAGLTEALTLLGYLHQKLTE